MKKNNLDSNYKHRLLLNAIEAAALLGIGRSHLYGLHASGQLPMPVKLGRRSLWRRDELERWVQAGCPVRGKWVLNENS